MASPQTDAAEYLIALIAECLDANLLHVPANRGVVWCTECVIPGCCDHLVAVMNPDVTTGCIPEQWEVPVMYGICYDPCTFVGADGTVQQPSDWLTAQIALARQLEEVLAVMIACVTCGCCEDPIAVTKFCQGGCAGFRLTYRLCPSFFSEPSS